MNIQAPVEQLYQRAQLDKYISELQARGIDKRTAAYGSLRQEFLFGSANDTTIEFDFKTPGCGRPTPANVNSSSEVLLDTSTRFVALYLGFELFAADYTAGAAGAAFSIGYSYPNTAVFTATGATTAFTALEALYNGTYQWQQTKTLSQLKYPMKAHRYVPPFISRNQEAAGVDVETPLQPTEFGQGFIRTTPRITLSGQSQNILRVVAARPLTAALFSVVPTTPTGLRFGLSAMTYGIFLDDIDNQILEELALL
jgi:hypothetical protein